MINCSLNEEDYGFFLSSSQSFLSLKQNACLLTDWTREPTRAKDASSHVKERSVCSWLWALALRWAGALSSL